MERLEIALFSNGSRHGSRGKGGEGSWQELARAGGGRSWRKRTRGGARYGLRRSTLTCTGDFHTGRVPCLVPRNEQYTSAGQQQIFPSLLILPHMASSAFSLLYEFHSKCQNLPLCQGPSTSAFFHGQTCPRASRYGIHTSYIHLPRPADPEDPPSTTSLVKAAREIAAFQVRDVLYVCLDSSLMFIHLGPIAWYCPSSFHPILPLFRF